jgi:hypothetical protein
MAMAEPASNPDPGVQPEGAPASDPTTGNDEGSSAAAPALVAALAERSRDFDGSSADPERNCSLAERSRDFDGSSADPERNCWMAVHEQVHGMLPSEYDIREVPEALYLAVLARRRQQEQTG